MINDLINQMVEAGVHLGHQTRKWHPSMKKYLLKDKAGIHIINLEETEKCLDKACSFSLHTMRIPSSSFTGVAAPLASTLTDTGRGII